MVSLPDDFVDMLDAFRRHGVRHVVVGAVAMARHGYVRATGDLDILVEPTLENSRNVTAALTTFGVPLFGVDEDYFSLVGNILQVGLPPLRVDVLTAIEGVSFSTASANAVATDIGYFRAPFLSLDDLLLTKKTNPRPKDAADALELDRLVAERNAGKGRA